MKSKLFLILFLVTTLIYSSSSGDVKPIAGTGDLDKIMDENKGNILLVNFYATWCVPCVKEFPDIIKLYNDYKDQGLKVIFISADVPEEVDKKVKPFLAKQGVEFESYYINNSNPEEIINYFDKAWQGSIPSTYIYDKNGNQTASIVGKRSYAQFEEELKKNLN